MYYKNFKSYAYFLLYVVSDKSEDFPEYHICISCTMQNFHLCLMIMF